MNQPSSLERQMIASFSEGSKVRQTKAALLKIALTKIERRICEVLVTHLGNWVPHDRIVAYVYSDHADGGPLSAENVISVTMVKLPDKLIPHGFRIESQAGAGRRMLWTPKAAEPEQFAPSLVPAAVPIVLPTLRDGDIEVGTAENGAPIGIAIRKLIEGRLLIQGTSGAGKSWTLRRLIEQSFGLIQQIIIDPEGEFKGLAEKYGHLYIAAHKLDISALTIAARRIREHRLSVLLDLSDLDREGQLLAVATFFISLIDVPRDHWHQVLVVVDEAQLFAPFGGQAAGSSAVRKAVIGATVDLMSRGRKRGLCGVLATLRIARLSKSVASEIHNFMVGLNTLDLDIRRAAETIGWDARRAFDRLPMLQPGDFVAVGPAFSNSPISLKVGPVQTKHVGEAPSSPKPDTVSPGNAATILELEALVEASAADKTALEENALVPGLRAVRAFIRDPHFILAAKIWEALRPLLPEGARLSDLASHLGARPDDVLAAVALLDTNGALDFLGEGDQRAARIARGMRP